LFGNSDDAFLQSKPKKGLLTPAEVRAIALAQMGLTSRSVVWDVGAGSGAVAIEAAQIAASGKTFAIEMDAEDHELIVANAERFAVKNLTAILGRAPEAFKELPDADAIFLGGSGREIVQLLDEAWRRLKPNGRLLANVSSIESLSDVHAGLLRLANAADVWMINVARGMHQLERVRFDALAPTFLLAASKRK
jgi:precorrin-6Y C5,15-methyltransferase (decarboxylating)